MHMLKAAGCVQVVVVANPANTNAVILSQCAPSIPRKNITCLTRLDHNRALGQVTQSAFDIHVIFFAATCCPWVQDWSDDSQPYLDPAFESHFCPCEQFSGMRSCEARMFLINGWQVHVKCLAVCSLLFLFAAQI